jgi:hypothetical protein
MMMEKLVEWMVLAGETEVLGENATLSITNLTCQTRARTRAASVGSQRLTTSAMARPPPSSEDENRSSFGNVVFFIF